MWLPRSRCEVRIPILARFEALNRNSHPTRPGAGRVRNAPPPSGARPKRGVRGATAATPPPADTAAAPHTPPTTPPISGAVPAPRRRARNRAPERSPPAPAPARAATPPSPPRRAVVVGAVRQRRYEPRERRELRVAHGVETTLERRPVDRIPLVRQEEHRRPRRHAEPQERPLHVHRTGQPPHRPLQPVPTPHVHRRERAATARCEHRGHRFRQRQHRRRWRHPQFRPRTRPRRHLARVDGLAHRPLDESSVDERGGSALARPVGCEFQFKPPSVVEISRGRKISSGSHRGKLLTGLRCQLSGRVLVPRVPDAPEYGCNIPGTSPVFVRDPGRSKTASSREIRAGLSRPRVPRRGVRAVVGRKNSIRSIKLGRPRLPVRLPGSDQAAVKSPVLWVRKYRRMTFCALQVWTNPPATSTKGEIAQ